ncbi:MAG: hypothetical protein ACXWZL_08540, partial [Mycobacterium sp.]
MSLSRERVNPPHRSTTTSSIALLGRRPGYYRFESPDLERHIAAEPSPSGRFQRDVTPLKIA